MQTREQIYATAVYNKVIRLKQRYEESNPPKDKDKYTSIAHKLPALIRSAGLAQALVFVDTRKDEQKDIVADLEAVLHEAGILSQNQNLLDRSRLAEISEYMLLTEHVLAALLWFKRYAQSVLEGVVA